MTSYKKGFTILETLVSISIIFLAITGATSAVRIGLKANTNAKDEIKAYYLAQEATETLLNKRNANILNNLSGANIPWHTGFGGVGDPCITERCVVDMQNGGSISSIGGCSSTWDSCPFLLFDSALNTYGHSTGNTTNFRREIQVENTNANEVGVTVRVSWTQGTTPRNIMIKTIITNWL